MGTPSGLTPNGKPPGCFPLSLSLTTVTVLCLVAQSCPTLCHPRLLCPRGILQARILEWVAMPSSRGSSKPRDPTQGSNPGLPHCRRIIYHLSHQGSPRILEWLAYLFSRGSSRPTNQTRSPALQADSLSAELPRKPNNCNYAIIIATFWQACNMGQGFIFIS